MTKAILTAGGGGVRLCSAMNVFVCLSVWVCLYDAGEYSLVYFVSVYQDQTCFLLCHGVDMLLTEYKQLKL